MQPIYSFYGPASNFLAVFTIWYSYEFSTMKVSEIYNKMIDMGEGYGEGYHTGFINKILMVKAGM